MKSGMGIATFVLVIGAFTLTACTDADPAVTESTATATDSTPTETTATPPATISTVADLVGDWEDAEAQWVVHFKDDGTYVEDFQGHENFGVGKYTVEDGKVLLTGEEVLDSGPIEGEIKDQQLVFKLGTLTRK